MEVVKETLNVAGLLTNVYARGDLRDKHSSEPVVVLFFLHGRGESADVIDPTARAAFAWVDGKEALSKQTPRDFIVVTFVRHSDSLKRPPLMISTVVDLVDFGRTSAIMARE
jgi:hypothetical protein